MKTVRNKTNRPLRVSLSRGKTLHLGPRMQGQISGHDVDAEGVKRRVEAGELEILGEGTQAPGAGGRAGRGHADTHGHHPDTSVPKRGDR